jgi:pimeloyl-ACP methyl ester carboxylesterase
MVFPQHLLAETLLLHFAHESISPVIPMGSPQQRFDSTLEPHPSEHSKTAIIPPQLKISLIVNKVSPPLTYQMEEFIDSESGNVCCSISEAGGKSAAILTHGYLSNKSSRTNSALIPLLNEKGISTIAFDMYGHGKSEGDMEHLTVSKVVSNALAVHDFARSRGYSKIAFGASSFSGSVALISATKRKFSALALRCPVFDGKKLWDSRLGKSGIADWKKKKTIAPFGKNWHFEVYEDESKFDMPAIAAKVEAPTIVIHGDLDSTVPLSQAEELVSSLKCEKKFVVVKGADHFFNEKKHFDQMLGATFDWLVRHL